MSAPARLLLIRHAPTAATRRHAFPADEQLDPRGREAAAAMRGRIPATDRAVAAPVERCRETAVLAGFGQPDIDPLWSELDFGAWAGLTLAEVSDREPQRLSAWLADPQIPPPDGEAAAGLVDRVRTAMADLCRPGTTTAVFTSAGPVKAALLVALSAPLAALWRVDVLPCAVTVLHGHWPQWTIRSVNAWHTDVSDGGTATPDSGSAAPRGGAG